MAWTTVGNIRGPQGTQGPAGLQGPAGPVGPAGLNWRGPWSNATAYAADDSVGWGGSTYFATAAKAAGSPPPTGTAGDPGEDTALNAGWALLAIEGARGVQGVQGIQGVQGQVGPKGDTGLKGDTGQQGPQGLQGTPGIQGTQGDRGLQGLTGPEGPQGQTGSTGGAGPTGQTGPAGARGTKWFVGTGTPNAGNTSGSLPGDQYLDQTTGDVYGLT